jgi:multicomponent Na+:H+ antiporter subunit G
MTGWPHLVAVCFVVAGTAVIIASCLGALTAQGPFAQLHFGTPVTSLSSPLIAIGLSIKNGLGLTTASVLFPAALLFFSGPLLSSAIARTMAERDRTIDAGPKGTGDTGEGAEISTGQERAR